LSGYHVTGNRFRANSGCCVCSGVTSNYNGSQISCNGISDGVITVTSSGGTGDAIYVFDQFPVANQSGRFSGIFTGVPAGVGYTFTVTDANGCPVVTAPIDVTEPLALNVSGIATSNFNGFQRSLLHRNQRSDYRDSQRR
jgi:hypothetical protein